MRRRAIARRRPACPVHAAHQMTDRPVPARGRSGLPLSATPPVSHPPIRLELPNRSDEERASAHTACAMHRSGRASMATEYRTGAIPPANRSRTGVAFRADGGRQTADGGCNRHRSCTPMHLRFRSIEIIRFPNVAGLRMKHPIHTHACMFRERRCQVRSAAAAAAARSARASTSVGEP